MVFSAGLVSEIGFYSFMKMEVNLKRLSCVHWLCTARRPIGLISESRASILIVLLLYSTATDHDCLSSRVDNQLRPSDLAVLSIWLYSGAKETEAEALDKL